MHASCCCCMLHVGLWDYQSAQERYKIKYYCAHRIMHWGQKTIITEFAHDECLSHKNNLPCGNAMGLRRRVITLIHELKYPWICIRRGRVVLSSPFAEKLCKFKVVFMSNWWSHTLEKKLLRYFLHSKRRFLSTKFGILGWNLVIIFLLICRKFFKYANRNSPARL